MHQGSGRIKIDYSSLQVDGEVEIGVSTIHRLVGPLSIYADNRCLYFENDFCVAEFAIHLRSWLERVEYETVDFFYESVESAEKDLVWIKNINFMWRIGSVHQKYSEEELFSLSEIRTSIESFIEKVCCEMKEEFGKDFDEIYREYPLSY